MVEVIYSPFLTTPSTQYLNATVQWTIIQSDQWKKQTKLENASFEITHFFNPDMKNTKVSYFDKLMLYYSFALFSRLK